MAAQFASGVTKAGRVWYQVKGKFTSKARFDLERRRGPGGRFGSKSEMFGRMDSRQLESYMQSTMGAPLGGGTWVAKIRKSSERFADILADANQL